MGFSSPYLLCSIALTTDVRRSISSCVSTSFCMFTLVEQGLLFEVLERFVVQLLDWMDPRCALAQIWRLAPLRVPAILTVSQIREQRLLHLWLPLLRL